MMNREEMMKKRVVSEELKKKVEDKVVRCLEKAVERFGGERVRNVPEVRFETIGRAAGWAVWNGGKPYIDINPILLNENEDRVVNQTVPHEIAHIVSYEVFGLGIKPHGREWKSVMRLYGLEPERCHNMDTTTVFKLRNKELFSYRCKCMVHKLTLIKHNRAKNGGEGYYRCRVCNGGLVYEGCL